MPLEDYKKHFEGWLEAFKEGDLFEHIVEGFEHDWSSIYKELHRIFKRDVWNHVLEQRARERDQYKSDRGCKIYRGSISTETYRETYRSYFIVLKLRTV